MIYGGPGFLAVVRSVSSPTPLPPVSKLDRRHTWKTEKERQVADRMGVGKKPNNMTASLVFYKSFNRINTLCPKLNIILNNFLGLTIVIYQQKSYVLVLVLLVIRSAREWYH